MADSQPITTFKTPERVRAANRQWRRDNPDKFHKYSIAYANRYLDRRLWSVAKQRAKRRGIDFSITYADIIVPEFCPVLGIKLVSGVGKSGRPGGNKDSPSLDRIDPSLGYIPGNVRVISHLANSMKGSATKEQLLRFSEWVQRGCA